MSDTEHPDVPKPAGRLGPDFHQPILVTLEDLHRASLYFSWGQRTVGFGQCNVYRREDGTIVADTENMDKEWLRRALYAVADLLVEQATIE